MKKFWRSGLIFTAANFLVGIGNFGFQAIIRRHITTEGEYGLVNSTLVLINLLGLPVAIAIQAVTHYIARFNFSGEDSRLQGLLAGCQKFLLHLTIIGSLLAIILVKPLGDFFQIPRTSLVIIALFCILAGLWVGFATALCQGMGWFKRLALISLLTVVLRLSWGGLVVWKFPTAEWAVLATGVSMLAFAILLFWKKDLSRSGATPVSPWDREFVKFLVVAAACTGGTYCFGQGDVLVAQKYFLKVDMDAYSEAGVLARALIMTVGPILTILFTHRSAAHAHSEDDLREQFKLLGLYTIGLAGGALGLLLLRTYLLIFIGKYTPETSAMVGPLAWTMVFVGLIQALGMWALASRWIKISLLYGGVGLAYWLILLALGRSPAAMLRVMPITAGIAFAVLFAGWLIAMLKAHPRSSKET